MRDYV